ncbi:MULTISPECIES: TerC/Alx family metal homeostasis membrane protein [Burkholderia]|uniref:Tellurite resistance protein TerC n=1 Tax=Burkholderia pyrrocinia TaxID=60550 RepID=A0A318HUF8_BURPY|nr:MULTISPECIES: TerC/Alx family metal homeostasis membrane protein [Burkholderia]PXX22039.1 tellurite resistance protein TerC [Burkholderia pyrrocinia]SFW90088.1 tellurite resistance protein TerC [Burkholderia sp. NFACC33-1]SFY46403.1 tellurite resistance protein TerC [Burkholderia sp. NFPP32]
MTTMPLGFPPTTIAVFALLALGAIAVDMLSHRNQTTISLRKATLWSIFWVAVSLAFAGYLWGTHGKEAASLFVTGYALEKVLSIDNLFVFMAIFAWFKVPDGLRHRVLYWGIAGAIVFRLVFVAIGTGLLSLGPWVELVFAAIVAWTAVMMLRDDDSDAAETDYSRHIAYRAVHKFFPVWPTLQGSRFFVRRTELEAECRKPENAGIRLAGKGAWVATPLFLCVVVAEVSDVLFAFDSVPAVIAVSKDPMIVYSAMLFAILGLRTMYFVLEALKRYLVHLEKAVVALLFFIAAKLALNATDHLFDHGYTINPTVSLFVVLIVLAIGIVASVVFPTKQDRDDAGEADANA